MFHIELQGDHYQMGVKLGQFFVENGVTFPLRLDGFQLAHGRKSEAVLRNIFPEVCEEIRGVSDATGADYPSFAAWMLCMGCCMYNLEKNIPVEIRGCTAFAYTKEGRVIYGRNNDLPPYLKEGSKRELYSPAGGNRFLLTTSSFINGEEGMNEHGLAAAMTFVMTRPGEIRAGLNSCFIVRYLLEKASDTKSALGLMEKLPVASNCNILLADPDGEMAVVECTPREKRLRRAVSLNDGSILCAVNSFVSEEMKQYDAAGGEDYQAGRRYRTVMDSFSPHMKGDLIEATQRLLRGEYGFLCQYDDEPAFETVWSSVFDLKNRTVYRAEGDPRKTEFAVEGLFRGRKGQRR